MAFNITKGPKTPDFIDFGDVARWLELMVQFLEGWEGEDWMPSFDMVLKDEEHMPAPRTFTGEFTAMRL